MKNTWQAFRMHRMGMVGAVLLALLLGSALFAPLLSPRDPLAMQTDALLTAPGSDALLGTDALGRDVLSRILHGSRLALHVGLVSVGFALTAGCLLGVTAGYAGGKTDYVISRFLDILFSVPDVMLALAIMAVLGQKTTNVMLAIGIVYTPIFARVARGEVLRVKRALFVEAARSMGVRTLPLIVRHILPAAVPALIVQTTLSFAFAVLAESALSFLGLGVEPDTPSWGMMLRDGKDWLDEAWWISVFPGMAITLTVLSFNLVGDALRDALDPRLRGGAA
ncbi:MAG: ABC transporter permease [Verrucomicrobia bacterium]|nr:ABC transporter permease [Verrucomicrobiota bacterium]MCH8527249.1 ABC transporter permease [Kiritimatiellia bacterium]